MVLNGILMFALLDRALLRLYLFILYELDNFVNQPLSNHLTAKILS